MKTILITGAAGFIGSHTCRQFAANGFCVVACDNFNSYYSSDLKRARARWVGRDTVHWVEGSIADPKVMRDLFRAYRPELVVHLAAQAGVRHSLEAPQTYVESNIVGFLNVLESCRHYPVEHLVYASSSSVYGRSPSFPLSVLDRTDAPVSFYAASKKANEVMAYSYAHLYQIPCTGLRFFTVYGSWGRPDMAYWLFTEAIINNCPIRLFNQGKMRRDFTHIDDIVNALLALVEKPPRGDDGEVKHRLLNVGNGCPIELGAMVSTLEDLLQKPALRDLQPMQPGDVESTWADVRDLQDLIGFTPNTKIRDGLKEFVNWYQDYHANNPPSQP